MKKVFIIDGGAGRVISAIPALERYIKNNPDQDVKIFVYGWDSLFWSNKLLQNLTFNPNDKGTFNRYIKGADEIISPEPYRLPVYINQKCSLSEAFDFLINHSIHDDNIPKLYFSKQEMINAKNIINNAKKYQQKEKTIVIQPFGSTAFFHSDSENEEVLDYSNRSLSLMMYSMIVRNLSQKFNIILFADNRLHFKEDTFTFKLNSDLRTHASVISLCDYFIGCDSVGQHMARACNIPGTVIFGSTYPENVSYPDWFNIIDFNKDKRTYSPLRISDLESNLIDRMNSQCMDYSHEEINNICSGIIKNIDDQI